MTEPSSTTNSLTKERLDQLLKYDSDSGVFTNMVPRGNLSGGIPVGWDNDGRGYQRVTVDGKRYMLHHLAFLTTLGYLPDIVDHINGVKSDNRWANLRECTHQQNSRNRTVNKDSVSGVKGVQKRKNRFVLRLSGKYLGCYDNLELAEFMSNLFQEKLYGEFKRG